ncbi:hypothetical protein [Candidatus Villigracilis saccharophilus]|uniref:hypothetical protein n=1 Tax=Candidatus Villigracilis saccharophilus TaxID=3140684 RepID=UPI003134ADCF|nr:hypothetical protein [Anaerolineales bacterium]
MFTQEQQIIEAKIKEFCAANDIPLAELKWQPIPFSGEWGFATSFFQTAANEARAQGGKTRPAESARDGRAGQGADRQRGRHQPYRRGQGYLNLYFSTLRMRGRVVDEVLASGLNWAGCKKK